MARLGRQGKGVIWSKVITDPARAIPITAYEVNEKALKAYVSLFEISCRHCGTTTAPTYIKHHPKPKSQGGKETFYLCANCHAAHHYT
jgi:hypothetical protein